METTYSVTIMETSKDLTARDRIKMKDTSDAISLDAFSQAAGYGEEAVIEPAAYVVLSVHNEKANGDPDYDQFVILDKEGNKYVTGSDSFYRAFRDIWDELKDDPDPWQIKVNRKQSKNHTGKEFITCSLV